jgi:hypothetical protein
MRSGQGDFKRAKDPTLMDELPAHILDHDVKEVCGREPTIDRRCVVHMSATQQGVVFHLIGISAAAVCRAIEISLPSRFP